MAAHSSDTRWYAKCSGACDSIRRGSEEEMGSEFCFHGTLCICLCSCLLGSLGLQNVFWDRKVYSILGSSKCFLRRKLSPSEGISWKVSQCDYGVLPVCFRRNHFDFDCWRRVGTHEFLRLDDVCPTMAYFLVHNWSFQYMVSRWLALQARIIGLLRRLCDSSIFWSCWLHRRILGIFSNKLAQFCQPNLLIHNFLFSFSNLIAGRSTSNQGQGKISSE